MTRIFHPIRALRDSLQQIGAAVNASSEYSRAGRSSDTTPLVNPASAGIPL
jgi:hypothetical protein